MDFKDYKKQKKELEELLKNNAKKYVDNFFKNLLDATDGCRIAWTQYTPFFNDGDECIFQLHEFYVEAERGKATCFRGYDDEGNGWLDLYDMKTKEFTWKNPIEPNPNYNPDLYARLEPFQKDWNDYEDVFKEAFGDHVTVIASLRDDDEVEFEVEEYDHD